MASITTGMAGVGVNPQNISSSDAYKFRLGQGMQAVDRSAAARGVLNTGGTLKAAQDYGQGLASTEYGNEWQRQYQLAALNAGIGQSNAANNLAGLTALSGYGLPAAGGMAGAYGNYGNAGAGGTIGAQSAWNQGIGTAANSLGGWLEERRRRQQQVQNAPVTPAPGGVLN